MRRVFDLSRMSTARAFQHFFVTVVFPAPVVNFRAKRANPGLASLFAFAGWSRKRLPIFPIFGATSVSRTAVSTVSIRQKKGRIPEKR